MLFEILALHLMTTNFKWNIKNRWAVAVKFEHAVVSIKTASRYYYRTLITIHGIQFTATAAVCADLKLFDNSLFLLWPDGLCRDDVLLFITNAAPYMVKAAKSLDIFYTNMIHLTCLVHGLHCIAEEIHKHFPKVDNLIYNGKTIFLKASSRVLFVKTELPDILLPSQPIITRRVLG
jgi:hypothetical protein